jgi:hypothetical protein
LTTTLLLAPSGSISGLSIGNCHHVPKENFYLDEVLYGEIFGGNEMGGRSS